MASNQNLYPTEDRVVSTSVIAGYYKCLVNSLNLRSESSMNSRVVAKCRLNDVIKLDNWSTVSEGYVWGKGIYNNETFYVVVRTTGGKNYLQQK